MQTSKYEKIAVFLLFWQNFSETRQNANIRSTNSIDSLNLLFLTWCSVNITTQLVTILSYSSFTVLRLVSLYVSQSILIYLASYSKKVATLSQLSATSLVFLAAVYTLYILLPPFSHHISQFLSIYFRCINALSVSSWALSPRHCLSQTPPTSTPNKVITISLITLPSLIPFS